MKYLEFNNLDVLIDDLLKYTKYAPEELEEIYLKVFRDGSYDITKDKEDDESYYISLLGLVNYPDLKNVKNGILLNLLYFQYLINKDIFITNEIEKGDDVK